MDSRWSWPSGTGRRTITELFTFFTSLARTYRSHVHGEVEEGRQSTCAHVHTRLHVDILEAHLNRGKPKIHAARIDR